MQPLSTDRFMRDPSLHAAVLRNKLCKNALSSRQKHPVVATVIKEVSRSIQYSIWWKADHRTNSHGDRPAALRCHTLEWVLLMFYNPLKVSNSIIYCWINLDNCGTFILHRKFYEYGSIFNGFSTFSTAPAFRTRLLVLKYGLGH